MARHSPVKRHMGFQEAAEEAAEKSGESLAAGKAMVAAGARKASAAAKRRNPRLTKVAGVGKRKGAGQAG